MNIPPNKPPGLQEPAELSKDEPAAVATGIHHQEDVQKQTISTSSGLPDPEHSSLAPLSGRKAETVSTQMNPEQILKQNPERFILSKNESSRNEREQQSDADKAFERGKASFQEGNIEEAISHFFEGEKLKCPRCMNNLGLLIELFLKPEDNTFLEKLYKGAWKKGGYSQAAYNLGLYYKGVERFRDARICLSDAVFEGNSAACKAYADLLDMDEATLKLFHLYLGWKLENKACYEDLKTFCVSNDPEIKLLANFFTGKAGTPSIRWELLGICINFNLRACSRVRDEVKNCMVRIPSAPAEEEEEQNSTQPGEPETSDRKRVHFASEDSLTQIHSLEEHEQEEAGLAPPESKKKKKSENS